MTLEEIEAEFAQSVAAYQERMRKLVKAAKEAAGQGEDE